MIEVPARKPASGWSLILLLALLASSTASAQSGTAGPLDLSNTPFASRYTITGGSENVLTIDVQVWGQVNRPGQYQVPDRTDLIGLISFAGGPTESAKLEEIRIVRPLASGEKVQKVDIEEFIKSGNRELIPDLTPGDVVVVPASRSHKFARWSGMISVAALVANVVILANQN